jgi:catechol 2,3-dioxygenase-like lactoylglutathione lyase family enzyme
MTARTAAGPNYDGLFTPWVPVADLDRSVAWYQQVLHLELVFQADQIGWAELRTPTPGAVIGLFRTGPDGPRPTAGPPQAATLTFGVTDLASERRRLAGLDVEFGQYDQVIESLIAFVSFADPDGNPLMFCEVLHSPRAAGEVQWRPPDQPDGPESADSAPSH